MPDTQIPNSWLNRTETFDYGTVTGQVDNGVSQLDLSDATINYDIVDHMNATYPGNARAYLNGRIELDNSLGTYYLKGDSSKSGYLQFTQSKDDLDLGRSITMSLSGSGNTGYGNSHDEGFLKPNYDESLRSEEHSRIQASYSETGHNAYAYQCDKHVDHDLLPDHRKLDIGSGPGVLPLPAGTGVITTRVQHHQGYLGAGHGRSLGGALGIAKHNRQLIAQSARMIYTSTEAGHGNGTHMDKYPQYKSSKVGYYMPTPETMNAFESDGITPDPMTTFYNQQEMLRYGYKAWQNKANPEKNLPSYQYGTHYTLSMNVKLGSEIAAGEYVPVCFMDHPDQMYIRMAQQQLDTWAGANQNSKDKVSDIIDRICSSTGTDSQDPDWYKHMAQYFTLTTNHFTGTKRQVKDLVIYIGKPYNGNSKGGQYELVVYATGDDAYHPYNTLGYSRGTGYYRIETEYNRSTLAKCVRSAIDAPGDDFDPGSWNPLFFHFATNDVLAQDRIRYRNTNTSRLETFRYRSSTLANSVAAFGPGIMDFQPMQFDNTDLGTGKGYRHFMYRDYMTTLSGTGGRSSGYICTFLAVPGKVEGIAGANLHTYLDNYIVPTEAGHEDKRTSLTYFPQRTVGYELIGNGSEIYNTGESTWKDVDFIVDQSLETSASSFGLGEDHVLEIAAKLAPARIDSQLNPDSIAKRVTISIRGIVKKYLNPGLKIKYGLWNYKDENNPVQISEIREVRPDATGQKDSHMDIDIDLNSDHITYDTLNHSRLRIWTDG